MISMVVSDETSATLRKVQSSTLAVSFQAEARGLGKNERTRQVDRGYTGMLVFVFRTL